MTTQMWIILAVFVIFLTLVLSGKAKIHVAVLLIPIVLEITQVLTFQEAWSGLTNSSVIMMASMFVVCAGLNRTTLVAKLSRAIIKPGASDLQIMLGMLIPIIFLGLFINGMAICMIVIPLLSQVCAEQKKPMSKFVFPVTMLIGIWMGAFPIGGNAASYITLNTIVENLGGVGTFDYFTNLVVRIPYLIIGTILVLAIGVKIAPDNGNIPAIAGQAEANALAGRKGGSAPVTPEIEKRIMIIFTATVLGIIGCALAGVFGVKGLQVWYPAMLGAVLMVLTGCMSDREAIGAMGNPVVFLTIGNLPLATALTKTGADQLIADLFNKTFGHMNPIIIMAAMFLISMILTQFLTNAAVSNVFRMLAAILCVQNGWDPRGLMLAAIRGSDCGFMYPVANPAFTYAHEAGGYTVKQHFKMGFVYSIVWFAIFVVYVPIVFPLV